MAWKVPLRKIKRTAKQQKLRDWSAKQYHKQKSKGWVKPGRAKDGSSTLRQTMAKANKTWNRSDKKKKNTSWWESKTK